MATAEVVGIIKGLAAVVQDQQAASKDAYSKTQTQIQDLSATVHALSPWVRMGPQALAFTCLNSHYRTLQDVKISSSLQSN